LSLRTGGAASKEILLLYSFSPAEQFTFLWTWFMLDQESLQENGKGQEVHELWGRQKAYENSEKITTK